MSDTTITQYINQLCWKLNIEGTVGVHGNELELIALIKNCPFLYNKSLKDFFNITKKNEAWEAIANVFDEPVSNILSRWKTMIEILNKNKYDDKCSISFVEDMMFMLPHIDSPSNGNESSRLSANERIGRKRPYPGPLHVVSFIDAIKKHSILYDNKNLNSKNKVKRRNAWFEIASEFSLSETDCVVKWKKLLKDYEKYLRSVDMGNSDEHYEFSDKLSFLKEHISNHGNWNNSQDNINPASNAIVIKKKTEEIDAQYCNIEVVNHEYNKPRQNKFFASTNNSLPDIKDEIIADEIHIKDDVDFENDDVLSLQSASMVTNNQGDGTTEDVMSIKAELVTYEEFDLSEQVVSEVIELITNNPSDDSKFMVAYKKNLPNKPSSSTSSDQNSLVVTDLNDKLFGQFVEHKLKKITDNSLNIKVKAAIIELLNDMKYTK